MVLFTGFNAKVCKTVQMYNIFERNQIIIKALTFCIIHAIIHIVKKKFYPLKKLKVTFWYNQLSYSVLAAYCV